MDLETRFYELQDRYQTLINDYETLKEQHDNLDYKAIGQQAYDSGYTTGYMDCAVKMKENCCDKTQCWEPCGELGKDEKYARVYDGSN